jgi:hypothetical protein
MSQSERAAAAYPRRITTVHVEELGDELCIYDWQRNQVHTLNATAVSIWQQCDGRTSPEQMADRLRAELQAPDAEVLVNLGLNQLREARLLQDGTIDAGQALSRRQLMTRLGQAVALAPAIHSIVAPTPLEAQSTASRTFEFSGAAQLFTVPAGITQVTIAAYGAEGGASILAGGAGGLVRATLPVTPGEVLSVYVGGKGTDALGYGHEPIAGGFNGGGGSDGNGAGGGGASDVRRGTAKLVIAGGGGGTATAAPRGGAGGGTTGAAGEAGTSAGGGAGGSQTAGGAGGTAGINGMPGTPGAAGSGGQGGRINGTALVAGGGGGGGGYFGGGGGGGGWSSTGFESLGSGGGGGGSSFADPSATGVTHTQGARTGNGMVVISWT